MPNPEFFQTMMGRRYYEADIPRIVQALERIATALEQANGSHTKGQGGIPYAKGLQRMEIQTTEHAVEALRVMQGIKPCIVWIEEK